MGLKYVYGAQESVVTIGLFAAQKTFFGKYPYRQNKNYKLIWRERIRVAGSLRLDSNR